MCTVFVFAHVVCVCVFTYLCVHVVCVCLCVLFTYNSITVGNVNNRKFLINIKMMWFMMYVNNSTSVFLHPLHVILLHFYTRVLEQPFTLHEC